jgi:dipeptidyl aminopeptidase/acylaminoacyl peptidase
VLPESESTLTESLSLNFGNDRVLFTSEQDGWNHLYSVSTSGSIPLLLTPGDFDVEDVTLSADGKMVLFSSNQGDMDRRHLWRVPISGGRPPEPLTTGTTIEWNPAETGLGHYLVCLGSSARSTAAPYRITPSGREIITRGLNADFPSAELVEPKPVIFKSEDGLEIHGQLFTPRAPASEVPAVIFIHGGPFRQMVLGFHYLYYYHYAYVENQYLAQRGFVVLSVNYRTGIMYGRDFRNAAHAGWRGSSEYKDVLAAARFLQGLNGVDPHRIGLWGGSYGGLLTALGLARNSDLFAAGVDLHGIHDWSTYLPELEASIPPEDLVQAKKLAFESSPVASLSTWKSPVLLIHGDDDRDVPFDQTVDLIEELRERKIPFEQLTLTDEYHDFLLWKSWVRAFKATTDFLERKLNNRGLPDPVPDTP